MRVWLCVMGLACMQGAHADTVRAVVRADLVQLSDLTGVEAKPGELGVIGIPKSGFCAYVYGDAGLEITDSSGTYKEGPTPDGCFAPPDAAPPEFVFTCAPGLSIRFSAGASSDLKAAEMSLGDFKAEGGRLTGGPFEWTLECEAEEVRVTAFVNFTVYPDAEPGEGRSGVIELTSNAP